MVNKIGNNAGIIWYMLSRNGRISLEEINELTDFESYNILLSLGWLAKEKKVELTMKDGFIYAELVNMPTEYYY